MTTCEAPLEIETLTRYWLAELPETEESAVEEHFLGCERCAGELATLVHLIDGIASTVRDGNVRVVVEESFLRRAAKDRLRTRGYSPWPGDVVDSTFAQDDALFVLRLIGDFSDARRVDVAWCDAGGVERERVRDVPLYGYRREIIWLQRRNEVRGWSDAVSRARVLDVTDDGESVIAEYTFQHASMR